MPNSAAKLSAVSAFIPDMDINVQMFHSVPLKDTRRGSESVISDGIMTPPTSPGPSLHIPEDISMAEAQVELNEEIEVEGYSTNTTHGQLPESLQYSPEADVLRTPQSPPRRLSEEHIPMETAASLKLTDFEVRGALGNGTFGKVLLVRLKSASDQPGSLKSFALKVLRKSEVVRHRQVEHVNSERYILSRVRHPFIVDLYATFQDDLNIYMLLSYVPGGELFTHLRRARKFTPDVTRFYLATIILALKYLHSYNIIYRDLKPENLLLDTRGYLRLTDFGFAKIVDDRTWTLCGTPEYLAPEIIQSDGHGKAADWWACGILCYEMLVGYPPFYDETPYGIYEKILRGRIHFPREMDPLSRELIRGFLHPDRSKRLGNMNGGSLDVLNHPWFRGVDWDALERREIRAPIIPHVSSPDDTRHFSSLPLPADADIPGLVPGRSPSLTPLQHQDAISYQFYDY